MIQLGASARRRLKALAEGETNPMALATLADERLRATPEQWCDALGACTDLQPVYRMCRKRQPVRFDSVDPMRKTRPALFRGHHFQDQIILLGVRWYLRYCLTLRDLEELMAERGLRVDHSTIGRWVLRYADRKSVV